MLFRDDVSKFASGYEEKAYAVFDGILGQLSKKEKNILYLTSALGFSKSGKSDRIKATLMELERMLL